MVREDRDARVSGPPTSGLHYEAAGGYVLSGLLVFGFLGMVLDRWLGLHILTPLGLVVGALLGGYLVYVRVVRVPDEPHKGEGA